MDLLQISNSRYATKAFDPRARIEEETINALKRLLQQSPSSVNLQPWHFVFAATDQGKARVIESVRHIYPNNEGKLKDASHIVVLCVKKALDEDYLQQLLENEDNQGRFVSEEFRNATHAGRTAFKNMQDNVAHWMEKQVYIALGTLLLGAASLAVDSCAMEGFDAERLDDELGLSEKGYRSLVLVALGWRDKRDFNAALPKARLGQEVVISDI